MKTVRLPSTQEQLEEIERIVADPNAHVQKLREENKRRAEKYLKELILQQARTKTKR